MTDNLGNKGIKDDEPVGSRRFKPRGKQRKRWVIEWRIEGHVSNILARTLRLTKWSVYSRYTTESRRDQALAFMVKRAEKDENRIRWKWNHQYRKGEDAKNVE